MDNNFFETIIIGAGHAGLSASYNLKRSGIEHIVFERGRIAESWRSQRWDSFVLNTANYINLLPGDEYEGSNPHGFGSAAEFVCLLEAYALKFQLPISENSKVVSVEKPEGQLYFNVSISKGGRLKSYKSRQVIVSSGCQNEKKVPIFAKNVSPEIVQLHTSEYRNAAQLPEGAVLVVGSAQSGCQIAEDLVNNGRKVYLSTSMVPRIPRSYRGKDIVDWLVRMKFFDARAEDITDPKMLQMKAPQLTGTGNGRCTISLQALSKSGIIIIGKMETADEKNITFKPNAAMHVQFADEFSKKVKGMVDEFILKNNIPASEPEADEADLPDEKLDCITSLTSLDMENHAIKSIIWTTGFSGNFNYIKLPVFDNDGNPKHQHGMTDVEGLYFLGLPWMRSRKSSIIFGAKDDAEFIGEKVIQYSQNKHSGIVASMQ